MQNRYQKRHFRPVLVTLFGIIVLAIVATLLEATHVVHFFHTTRPTSASQYTKGQSGSSATGTNTGNTSGSSNSHDAPQVNDQKANVDSTNTSTDLLAPIGDFVSDHHPNLSGHPAPNLETSVCTSTPGATCEITFTSNGITKSLPSETTDSGGSAYWNWKLQDIGLTPGSWQIQATASLNGQSKNASDSLQLVISQ
jgi:hypothetical protein